MTIDSCTYVYEKLLQTERSLALGEGDMRSRLSNSFLCFHTLMESDFPDEFRDDYKWIMSKLNTKDPFYNYKGEVEVGSVEMSLKSMKNKTAVRIAEKLLFLKDRISELVRSRGL